MFTSSLIQNQTVGSEENLLDIQVSVSYILKQKIGERDLFIFIALSVTSLSFSHCTEELGLCLVLLYTV